MAEAVCLCLLYLQLPLSLLPEKRREECRSLENLEMYSVAMHICFICLREIIDMRQGKEISCIDRLQN